MFFVYSFINLLSKKKGNHVHVHCAIANANSYRNVTFSSCWSNQVNPRIEPHLISWYTARWHNQVWGGSSPRFVHQTFHVKLISILCCIPLILYDDKFFGSKFEKKNTVILKRKGGSAILTMHKERVPTHSLVHFTLSSGFFKR